MRIIFLFIFGIAPTFLLAQEGILLGSVQGKPAIVHEVKAGETLYAISKKYNTSVEQLKKDNHALQQNELSINSTIAVFYKPALLVDVNQVDQNKCIPLLHQVKKGETLFGIAKRTYSLEVTDLKQWNKLSDNNISISQPIIVGWIYSDPAYHQNVIISTKEVGTTKSQDTIESSSLSDEKSGKEETGRIVYVSKGIQSNELTDLKGSKQVYSSPKNPYDEKEKVMQTEKVEETGVITEASPQVEAESTKTAIEKPEAELTVAPVIMDDKRLARDIFTEIEKDATGKYNLKKERGVAKWFKPENNSVQLFALHKHVPVGTVLKISNPINNYTVYVKVMGALSENDENQNAQLKISSNAMELLKVYDKVFLVDVSYYEVN